MSELARAAGGAVSFAADLLSGLEVDGTRMQSNLALTRGLVVAERVTLELAPHIGYDQARLGTAGRSRPCRSRRRCQRWAGRRVGRPPRPRCRRLGLRSAALEAAGARLEAPRRGPGLADVVAKLPADVFDPAAWLGSSELYVDRALDLYRKAYADD